MKVSQPTYTIGPPECMLVDCREPGAVASLPHRLFGCPEYQATFGEKKLPLVTRNRSPDVAVSPKQS